MNTLHGKNVAILGGLKGIGLKLTKNLLNKKVKVSLIDFPFQRCYLYLDVSRTYT